MRRVGFIGFWTAVLLWFCATPPFVWAADPLRVGDAIGIATASDITAVVNGKPIPSLNINGYTAVTAEDLREYGYDVAWLPYSRQLIIAERTGSSAAGATDGAADEAAAAGVSALPELPNLTNGWKSADVLFTDIETFYEGNRVDSYNIGGRTAILLNDLAPFGKLEWDGERRVISFVSQGRLGQDGPTPSGGNAEASANNRLHIRETESVKLNIEFHGERMYDGDTPMGFGEDGLPYFDVAHLAEKFGYSIFRDGPRYTVSENRGHYSFTLDTGASVVAVRWAGERVNDYEMIRRPFVRGGKLYAYSIDLEYLFGYNAKWYNEQRILNVTYNRYDVEDYGLPAKVDADRLDMRVALTELVPRSYLSPPIYLIMENSDILESRCNEFRSGEVAGPGEVNKTAANCPLELKPMRNTIVEKAVIHQRLIYKAEYDVDVSFDRLPLETRWDRFRIDGATSDTFRSDRPVFALNGNLRQTGEADAPTSFRVTVRKWEDGRGYVPLPAKQQTIQADSRGMFTLPFDLNGSGDGLFRVGIEVHTMTMPRVGDVYEEYEHFYIMLNQTDNDDEATQTLPGQ